jgi:hypothetical protein
VRGSEETGPDSEWICRAQYAAEPAQKRTASVAVPLRDAIPRVEAGGDRTSISSTAAEPMNSTDLSRLLLPIRASDHVHGSENAPCTLVEYSDYECLDCGHLYVVLRDLQSDLSSRLRIVFRHYPLSGIHPHAQQAAEAAEATAAQGKFWEVHTRLFEQQAALGTKDYRAPQLSPHMREIVPGRGRRVRTDTDPARASVGADYRTVPRYETRFGERTQ